MPTVTFLRSSPTGQQEMGTATLRAGRVIYDGLPEELRRELDAGIPLWGTRIKPKQGDAFLRALPVQYRGSYVRAVYEE